MSESAIADHDLMGAKVEAFHEEDLLHLTQLSEEELEIEARLRRKIDVRIMPMVILVYLMNYIDRFASFSSMHKCLNADPTS